MPITTTLATVWAGIEVIEFGKWIVDKIGEKGFDKVYSKLINIDNKQQFYEIVKETSELLETKYPHILGGNIYYFFQKEEVFNELINLLFIDAKVDEDIILKQFDVKTLPKEFITEFITLLKSRLLQNEDFRAVLTDKEVYLTCLGISNDVSLIKDFTSLSLDELSRIRKLLEHRFAKAFDEKLFKENYLRNSLNNLSQVNFMGLGIDYEIKKGKRKKVSQIFVRPSFFVSKPSYTKLLQEMKLKPTETNRIVYTKLFLIPGNIILLGNPGSGKSFVVKSIICSIINKSYSEFSEKGIFDYLPFRIELRKYLAFKRENGGHILNYLLFLLSSEYSINTVLESTIDRIVREEKTLFFFDGLDEIFNPIEKNDIKNDIENFHGNYPNVKSITTSRIEGYEDAAFDKDRFYELTIEKFNDKQIEEYLNLWYQAEEEDEEIKNTEIKDFLNKKDSLDGELIRNPLLLSLIVILYRNNLKLPESKLEIYKSCTSTLVDKWDSSKDLSIDLSNDILRRKETILADLAYWQYSELSERNGKKITYERAKNLVAQVILEKLKIGDEYISDSNADKFMNYALKRSIYFDNNFTHKTFLEYYTAFWIYTNIEKKHKKTERDELITKYIGNTFWHIVIELLINLIDKEQADDEIIDDIYIMQLENPSNSISFFLATLNSVQNISINVKKLLFYKSIEYIVNNLSDSLDKVEKSDYYKLTKYFNNHEYQDIIISEIQKYHEVIKTEDEKLTNLYILFCELLIHSEEEDKEFYLGQYKLDELKFNELSLKNEILYKVSYYVFLNNAINENWIDELEKYIKLFGLSQCYLDTPSRLSDTIYVPFLRYCVRNILLQHNIINLEENLNKLYRIGISFEDLLVHFFSKRDYSGFLYKEIVQKLNDVLSNEIDQKTEILIVAYLLLLQKDGDYIPREIRDNIHFEYEFNQKVKRILSRELEESIIGVIKIEYDVDYEKINNLVDNISDYDF